MATLFMIIGAAFCLWVVAGLVIMSTMQIIIDPSCPLRIRIMFLAQAAVTVPYISLMNGKFLKGMALTPVDQCPCPECRAERGEG